MSPRAKSVVELVALFRDTQNFSNVLQWFFLDSMQLNSMDSVVGRQDSIWCCTCEEAHATDTLVSNVAPKGGLRKRRDSKNKAI